MRQEPEEIPDTEHELVLERVCAIDVAKDSGKVCVRVSGRAGRRVSGHARRSTAFRGPEDADIAILQGTAGSTGTPRTTQISPAASLANLRSLVSRVNVDHRCRLHSSLPIYHDMGLAFLLVATRQTCGRRRRRPSRVPRSAGSSGSPKARPR